MYAQDHADRLYEAPLTRRLPGYLKQLLSYAPYSKRLDSLMRLPKLRAYRTPGVTHYASREELFAKVQQLAGQPFTYLEFGVDKGASIRDWATYATHSENHFIGFDSFVGLPEKWTLGTKTLEAGHFNNDGKTPLCDDPRVSFVKGWFQDSLPGFLETFAPEHRLIIHCDADVYSATHYVLAQMDRFLVRGSYVLFDDFSSMLDDVMAWEHHCAAFRRTAECRVLADGRSYLKHAAFELTNQP